MSQTIKESRFTTDDGTKLYFVDGSPAVFRGWNQPVATNGPHVDDFFEPGGAFRGPDEHGLAPTFQPVDAFYLLATIANDDGHIERCDRGYALGEDFTRAYLSDVDANESRKEFQEDVGTVVEAGVVYSVEPLIG